MKKFSLILLMLITTTVAIQAQDRPADKAAIKQTLGRFGNSWTKGDLVT